MNATTEVAMANGVDTEEQTIQASMEIWQRLKADNASLNAENDSLYQENNILKKQAEWMETEMAKLSARLEIESRRAIALDTEMEVIAAQVCRSIRNARAAQHGPSNGNATPVSRPRDLDDEERMKALALRLAPETGTDLTKQ